MIFQTKTFKQKEAEWDIKWKKLLSWHKWFAWHPVKWDGGWAWFSFLERRYPYRDKYLPSKYIDYRPLQKRN